MKLNEFKQVYFGGDLSYKAIIYSFLDNTTNFVEVKDIKVADLVYWVYGKGPSLKLSNINFWTSNNKKFILHWIGTDVQYHVNKVKSNQIKSRLYHNFWNSLLKRKIAQRSMINFCSAPWLCDELYQVGVKSFYLPLTTINRDHFSFNEKHRIYDFISYLPQNRLNLYNGELILRIARSLNTKRFLLIIPDIKDLNELKLDNIPANVNVMPKQNKEEMYQIYRNSKCFLRFTNHDGLSLSVIESLANRLQVFWTYNFPFVNQIQLKDERFLINELNIAIEKWEPNYLGQEYVLNNLDISVINKLFEPYYQKLYGSNS